MSPTGSVLRIVQFSDPQLGFTDVLNRGRKAQAQGVPEQTLPLIDSRIDESYLEQAIAEVKALDPAPDAVIVAGDLVNDWQNLAQWDAYTRLMGSLDLPVYEVMGNHDGFCEAGLHHFRETLCKQDFYSVILRDVLIVVLNSSYLKHPDTLPVEARTQRCLVEQTLSDNATIKHKLMLMHHPLFFEAPDEEESYFNLPPAQRSWVLGLVDQYNIRAVISGHYHRNSVIKYNETDLITTGPTSEVLGNDSDGSPAVRGFRLLELNLESGVLDHTYLPLKTV